jgi:hypothetical protein
VGLPVIFPGGKDGIGVPKTHSAMGNCLADDVGRRGKGTRDCRKA